MDNVTRDVKDIKSIDWVPAPRRVEVGQLHCAFCSQEFTPPANGAAAFIDASRTFAIWVCPTCEPQSTQLTQRD
jgi:hypothetical protein